MNSAYRPDPAIKQQNGHAIGSANTNAPARLVRYQGITFAFAVTQAMSVQNMIGVNLAESDTNFRTAGTRAETVSLPDKFLKSITAVDPVSPEPKRGVHGFEL
jgi:hypothetical protein